jgi:hypothetical protein
VSIFEDSVSERYFHELEDRERIAARAQFNYAVYASFITVTAYMLRMVDFESPLLALIIFYEAIFASIIPLAISIRLTWSVLTGYKYFTVPKMEAIIDYKNELIKRAKDIEEQNKLNNTHIPLNDPEADLDSFTIEIMSECIDQNYKVNELRRDFYRKSLTYFLYASIPLVVSSVIFVGSDLDVSSPRKIAASYAENAPLIKYQKSTASSLSAASKSLSEEVNRMANQTTDDKRPAPQQSPTNAPTPPPAPPMPQKPRPQVSLEDYKGPIPDKSKILNEGK